MKDILGDLVTKNIKGEINRAGEINQVKIKFMGRPQKSKRHGKVGHIGAKETKKLQYRKRIQ